MSANAIVIVGTKCCSSQSSRNICPLVHGRRDILDVEHGERYYARQENSISARSRQSTEHMATIIMLQTSRSSTSSWRSSPIRRRVQRVESSASALPQRPPHFIKRTSVTLQSFVLRCLATLKYMTRSSPRCRCVNFDQKLLLANVTKTLTVSWRLRSDATAAISRCQRDIE